MNVVNLVNLKPILRGYMSEVRPCLAWRFQREHAQMSVANPVNLEAGSPRFTTRFTN